MSSPSAAAIAAIKAHVTDWSPTDAAIVANLNLPTIANPVSVVPQVLPIIDASSLMSHLTDPNNGSIGKVANWPNLNLLTNDIEIQNRSGIGLWAFVLTAFGAITSGERTAINAYLASTIADPNWPSLVSWSSINLGRSVDSDDIQTARIS
jgi:hypothetical protein